MTNFPSSQTQPEGKMTFLKFAVTTLCIALDVFYVIGRMIATAQEVEK